jgi:peptidoglycan-associated lipoprotein
MVVLLVGLAVLSGCPKKTEITAVPEPQQEQTPVAEAAPPEQKEEAVKSEAAAPAKGLQPVYFDFDQSFIDNGAREVMKANAEWLTANPQSKIKIEGNCDERGTLEYNQALGQRRAANAKKYLTDLGISGSRISLISYGKEKPVCTENSESCWQKNRRDEFVVVPD